MSLRTGASHLIGNVSVFDGVMQEGGQDGGTSSLSSVRIAAPPAGVRSRDRQKHGIARHVPSWHRRKLVEQRFICLWIVRLDALTSSACRISLRWPSAAPLRRWRRRSRFQSVSDGMPEEALIQPLYRIERTKGEMRKMACGATLQGASGFEALFLVVSRLLGLRLCRL